MYIGYTEISHVTVTKGCLTLMSYRDVSLMSLSDISQWCHIGEYDVDVFQRFLMLILYQNVSCIDVTLDVSCLYVVILMLHRVSKVGVTGMSDVDITQGCFMLMSYKDVWCWCTLHRNVCWYHTGMYVAQGDITKGCLMLMLHRDVSCWCQAGCVILMHITQGCLMLMSHRDVSC